MELISICIGNRIVSIWNSFPDYVINANTIGIFDNRLDHFRAIKHVIMILLPN